MNVDRSSFLPAVQHFWETRRAATERQRRSAAADKGGRQAVTSGGHLDGFLDVIESVITGAGLANAAEVKRGRRVPVLPGYFRPENEWDLVVLRGGRLGAAIELKAQVGPSFGNNFNNRAEEALGSADDFWTAYPADRWSNPTEPLGRVLTDAPTF